MKQFEKNAVTGILNSEDLAVKAFSTPLSGEYFSNVIYGFIYDRSKEYWNKYRSLPSKKVIKEIIFKWKFTREEDKKLYFKKASILYGKKVEDYDFSLDVISKEIKKRKFIKNLGKATDIIEKGREIDDAIRLMAASSSNLSDFVTWSVYDYLDRWEERQKERREYKKSKVNLGAKTLLKRIDLYLKKGVLRGEFASIGAKTGTGKTNFLVQVGFGGVLQGYNVTHIILENKASQVETKYDSRVTGVSYDMIQMYDFSGKNKKYRIRANKTIKYLRDNLSTKIKIVHSIPNKTTSETIYGILNHLEAEGHFTDVLIIDSPDIMNSVSRFDQKRLQQAAIYWELKSLGIEKNLILWGSSQLKAIADDEKPSSEMMSEAYDKSRILDKFIILLRNLKDRINNTCTVYCAKDRDGQDGWMVKLPVDFSRMLFKGDL